MRRNNPIKALIEKINKTIDLVKSQHNNSVDTSSMPPSVTRPYLHQDTEYSTKEESADFEKNNLEAFNYIRNIESQIGDIFKRK